MEWSRETKNEIAKTNEARKMVCGQPGKRTGENNKPSK
jgi:hypothetical protein